MKILAIILLSLAILGCLSTGIGAVLNLDIFFKLPVLKQLEESHGRLVARLTLGVIGGSLLISVVLMLVVIFSIAG
ncbi:MAG: hypothetical protein AAGI38_08445 [Bacteroidota bacterium]